LRGVRSSLLGVDGRLPQRWCMSIITHNKQPKQTHIDLLGQLCPEYDTPGYCGGGKGEIKGENTCDF